MKACLLALLSVTLLALASCVHVSESGDVVWGEDSGGSDKASVATKGAIEERQSEPNAAPAARPFAPTSAHAIRLAGNGRQPNRRVETWMK